MALLSSVPFGRSVGRSVGVGGDATLYGKSRVISRHKTPEVSPARNESGCISLGLSVQSFTKALARHASWRHLLDSGLA